MPTMPHIADPMPLDALTAIEHLLTDEERMIRDAVRRFRKPAGGAAAI